MKRIASSDFYDLTSKDSTIVVSSLSEATRETTWVQDLNRYAEKHTGNTFIFGTEGNDLLKGGAGNDFLEGGAGDDRFRDDGGYNILLGGRAITSSNCKSHWAPSALPMTAMARCMSTTPMAVSV